MKRVVAEELLDMPNQSPIDVALCLDDLRSVNRRAGGNKLHSALLQRASAGLDTAETMQLLEVASGRADVLQHAALGLQRNGYKLQITLLDQKTEHFPSTSHWEAQLPKPECVLGDALAMPFADNSFDIVSCCLFVHHLRPEEFAQFLASALRIARHAVVINDLERSRIHWLLAHAGRVKYRSRLTKYDAAVSVRRAYTLKEMQEMLINTGHRFDCWRAYLFRLGAIIWKK